MRLCVRRLIHCDCESMGSLAVWHWQTRQAGSTAPSTTSHPRLQRSGHGPPSTAYARGTRTVWLVPASPPNKQACPSGNSERARACDRCAGPADCRRVGKGFDSTRYPSRPAQRLSVHPCGPGKPAVKVMNRASANAAQNNHDMRHRKTARLTSSVAALTSMRPLCSPDAPPVEIFANLHSPLLHSRLHCNSRQCRFASSFSSTGQILPWHRFCVAFTLCFRRTLAMLTIRGCHF